MGVGGIGLAAARKNAKDLVVKQNPDFDKVGIADRINPEGPPDLAGDFLAEDRIENGKERPAARWRQTGLRLNGDVEFQPLPGNAGDFLEIGILRVGVNDIDDGCDIARDRG